ncbi:DUF3632 domain containing protein [Pyrenophora teres f. teres]|uniref:DUF3632 domain containing protein n=1 Tax=Pyrenophora teres f. teres TaxID=97479 RepID=A0A6S6VTW4_9PLEO|nr:hypothetical protein PTNB29_01356 [Pyrenophora teres f. teres]CAE7016030.1 DUF3632 domain containing protein [Pyrenophora teres f. teres]
MASIPSHTEQRVAFSEQHFRLSVDADIRQDPYTLIKRARMLIRNITNRYTNSDHDIGVFEVDLHDLWYLCIQAAKAIPEAEPAADQLACQVLRARSFGAMSRVGSGIGAASGEQAITSMQQRIWLDLPFLIDALQCAWAATSSDMTAVERRNLAGFTARLASFGIHTDELISCALSSFAKALETSSEAEIADQVPILVAWLQHGSFAILSASARGYASTKAQTVSTPGELFTRRNAEAGPAFTVARWDFWKQRFNELQQGLASDTAKQLQQCVGMMCSAEEMIGARCRARDDALKAYFL